MEEDTLHSDIFDSLDYLIPPIKKVYGSPELFTRNFRSKTPLGLNEVVHTTSSVILKSTTKKLIHEQYSILKLKKQLLTNASNATPLYKEYNKNCIIEDKPIIRVTVIPKGIETQTSKVFYKRRQKSKKIQSTVSNHENSIKNQSVCVMVKGKRREKVYEIKTTESTNLSNKFTNAKYEDLSIQQISDSKRLIQSLNMERRKRKDKGNARRIANEGNDYHNSFGQKHTNKKNENKPKDLSDHKSRVTIVGQVGLNRDDQYVLKCAATVNDQPITTHFGQTYEDTRNEFLNLYQDPKPFTSKMKETETYTSDGSPYRRFRQQDTNIQTDTWYRNEDYNFERKRNNRCISQATQVDLNFSSNKILKNQMAQCDCNNTNTANIFYTNDDKDVNKLKKYDSPLVIISVYPRNEKEGDINNPVKIINHRNYTQNIRTCKDNKNNINRESERQQGEANIKLEKSNYRSRSPSPTTKSFRNRNLEKKAMKKTNKMTGRPQSQINFNKSAHKINKSKKDESCYCPNSTCVRNIELPKKQINFNRGANETNVRQVKRALVNNFLKSVEKIDQKDAKTIYPRTDASRIEINLDGDKERYDVLFQQPIFNTDITIRKTHKVQTESHFREDEVDSSMENFLNLSDENMNTNKDEREAHDVSMLSRESRLNVRDSLEIGHSRDSRLSSRFKHTQVNANNNITGSFHNTKFLAPIKHYRGDNCSLLDPNERDKEIRELLGIIHNSKNPEPAKTPQGDKDNKHGSENVHCCCSTECSECLKKGFSLPRFFKSFQKKATNILNKPGAETSKEDVAPSSDSINQIQQQNTNINGSELNEDNKDNNKDDKDDMKDNKDDMKDNKDDNKDNKKDNKDNNKNIAHPLNLPKIECSCNKNLEGNSDKGNLLPNKLHQSTGDEHQKSVIEQNLILNRNIQVFLQIEQFTKQQPVMLTRKQYDKVKKTIQCTLSKKLSLEEREKDNLDNYNVISIGEVKVKPKLENRHSYDREVQTERSEHQKAVRCIQIQTRHDYNSRKAQNSQKIKKKLNEDLTKNESTNAFDIHSVERHLKPKELTPRNTVSSMEIRYANVAYTKHITVSSTCFKHGLHNKLDTSRCNGDHKSSNSIHTIFKGRRKSATPNLGTSAYSLYTDSTGDDLTKSNKTPIDIGDSKPKRPFLQRLISCLVMRSAETSVIKEDLPVQKPATVKSSIDSYRISTSLGALEMTSSLYDTSASFHSNHTTVPFNKMKRGFLSSVRGFLTSRRS